MQKLYIFPGTGVILAAEKVECFGEKARQLFPLPNSIFTY